MLLAFRYEVTMNNIQVFKFIETCWIQGIYPLPQEYELCVYYTLCEHYQLIWEI